MNNSPIPSANNIRYKNARMSLLLIVILSAANLFSTVLAQVYFLFSAYLPQLMITIGYLLSEEYGETAYIWVAGIIGLIFIIPYLLCWIFSKKHVGWMVGALVFFSLDSLIFLVDLISLLGQGDFSMIIDLVIRIWALVSLILGVKYGFQMKKEEQAAAIPTAAQADAVFGAPVNAFDTDNRFAADAAAPSGMTRRITVSRKKAFVGMAVAMRIFVNDREVCCLKNGESQSFSAPCEAFVLGGIFGTSGGAGKTEVPAGESDASYQASVHTGMTVSEIIFTPADTVS